MLRWALVRFPLVRADCWPTLRGMTPARIAPDTGPFSDPPTPSERQAEAADVESLRVALGGGEGEGNPAGCGNWLSPLTR